MRRLLARLFEALGRAGDPSWFADATHVPGPWDDYGYYGAPPGPDDPPSLWERLNLPDEYPPTEGPA